MALVYLTIMAFSLSLLIFWIHLDRKRLPIKRNSESGTINEYVKRFIAYGICRRYCYTQLPTYTNVHVLMFTQYVFVYIACVCVCVWPHVSSLVRARAEHCQTVDLPGFSSLCHLFHKMLSTFLTRTHSRHGYMHSVIKLFTLHTSINLYGLFIVDRRWYFVLYREINANKKKI